MYPVLRCNFALTLLNLGTFDLAMFADSEIPRLFDFVEQQLRLSSNDTSNPYPFQWPETLAAHQRRQRELEDNFDRISFDQQLIFLVAEPSDNFLAMLNYAILNENLSNVDPIKDIPYLTVAEENVYRRLPLFALAKELLSSWFINSPTSYHKFTSVASMLSYRIKEITAQANQLLITKIPEQKDRRVFALALDNLHNALKID